MLGWGSPEPGALGAKGWKGELGQMWEELDPAACRISSPKLGLQLQWRELKLDCVDDFWSVKGSRSLGRD